MGKLRTFLSKKDSPGSLGLELKRSLESDPLFPVFTLGIYRLVKSKGSNKYEDVHLDAGSFLLGVEKKLELLIDFIDGCIERYGQEKVLLVETVRSKPIDL